MTVPPTAHNRTRRGKGMVCLALLAVVATLAAACGGDDDVADTAANPVSEDTSAGSDDTGATPSGDDFVIGFTGPLSGPLAFLGVPLLAGIRTYFDDLNSSGGVDGRQVVIEALDDRNEGPTSAANTKQLIDDGAVAIFGYVVSQMWSAAQSLAAEEQVPQIAYATIEELVDPPRPFLYSAELALSKSAEIQVQFAEEQFEPEKYGLFTFDTIAAEDFRKAVESSVDEAGGTIVGTEIVSLTATDVSAQAASIARTDPDVVMMYLIDSQAPLAVASLRQRGMDAPIVNFFGGATDPTLEQANDPEFYVLRSAVWPTDPGAAGTEKMQEAAKTAGQEEHLNTFFTTGYVMGKGIAEALRNCADPCDGVAMNDALEGVGEVDVEELTGGMSVGPDDHEFVDYGRIYIWDQDEGISVPVTEWMQP